MVFGLAAVLAFGAVVLGSAGCRARAYVRAQTPAYAQTQGGYVQGGYAQPVTVQAPPVQATAQAGGQLLYLPVEAAQLPLQLIRGIVIQTTDGQVYQLTAADVQQALAGRLALRVPAGIVTGTATVYLTNGQTWSTTFHIAATSSGVVVGGAPVVPATDPRCQLPQGTWQGRISSDPRSYATVWLEVLGDCRTVRGYVRLTSGDGGSVDSTIEGGWDPSTYTLVGRDMQLFNIQIGAAGTGFCATDEYRLQLSGDGQTMQGSNTIYQAPCAGSSPVYLQRTQ